MTGYYKAIPWAAVGFLVGSFIGFRYGKKAQGNIGQAIDTDYTGGVLTMKVDTVKAASAGMADPLAEMVNGLF